MRFFHNNFKFIFIGIVLLAAVLRLWQLGTVPVSPDWDEAALGYNAYSLLITGKDEFGKSLPIVLQSFNDYKPALYVYLVLPLIPLLDVSLLAVRLPSVIAGIGAVILTYFWVKELFSLSKLNERFLTILSLLSMTLLAISPWHIQFSRIGFEANVALTCNLLFYLLFLKGLKKGFYLIPAAVFAGLTVYIYQSAKVFMPLMVLAYGLIFIKDLLQVQRKWVIAAIVTGALVLLPMVFFIMTTPDALIRAKGVSIFYNDQTQFLSQSASRLDYDVKQGDVIGKVLDNRRIDFAKRVLSNYMSHYNPIWLFYRGDSIRHHAPFMGILYIVEIPFILIGLYQLVVRKFSWKTKAVIFSQFLLAAVPAAITMDVPSAVRVLNILPVYQVFTALGIITFVNFVWSFKVSYLPKQVMRWGALFLFLIVGGLALYNVSYYLNQYFVQQNYFQSQAWQYGWKEAISYVQENRDKYDKIIITNKEPLDQSYMFYLYYTKFDPRIYQTIGGSKDGEFKATHDIQNISFRPLDWGSEEKSDRILYLGRRKDIPANVRPLKVIHYLDGTEAIIIVKGK